MLTRVGDGHPAVGSHDTVVVRCRGTGIPLEAEFDEDLAE